MSMFPPETRPLIYVCISMISLSRIWKLVLRVASWKAQHRAGTITCSSKTPYYELKGVGRHRRDDSVVRSACCYSRELEFSSQRPCWAAYNPSCRGSGTLFWPPQTSGTHVAHKHTSSQNTIHTRSQIIQIKIKENRNN